MSERGVHIVHQDRPISVRECAQDVPEDLGLSPFTPLDPPRRKVVAGADVLAEVRGGMAEVWRGRDWQPAISSGGVP